MALNSTPPKSNRYNIGRALMYASQMAMVWALVMLLIQGHGA